MPPDNNPTPEEAEKIAFRNVMMQTALGSGAESQENLMGAAYIEKYLPDASKLLTSSKHKNAKFNREAKARYLQAYMQTGRRQQAAMLAGVHKTTVEDHLAKDDAFREAYDMATDYRKERVIAEVDRRGVEGVVEPVFGKTASGAIGVVGYKRVYSDTLLAMEARRLEPAYKDKGADGAGSGGGGVLVIELRPQSETPIEDWEDAWEGITIEGDYSVKEPEEA